MEDLTESAKCQKMVDMEEYGNCGERKILEIICQFLEKNFCDLRS